MRITSWRETRNWSNGGKRFLSKELLKCWCDSGNASTRVQIRVCFKLWNSFLASHFQPNLVSCFCPSSSTSQLNSRELLDLLIKQTSFNHYTYKMSKQTLLKPFNCNHNVLSKLVFLNIYSTRYLTSCKQRLGGGGEIKITKEYTVNKKKEKVFEFWNFKTFSTPSRDVC